MEQFSVPLERFKKQNSITHLYIKDGHLRATYHLDNIYASFWEASDYDSSGNEVVDTPDINDLFFLDYREKDITDTLAQNGYFLVGESNDFLPDYLKKFFIEFHNYLISETPKVIKRTHGNGNLIYLPLFLKNSSILWKKYAQIVRDILAKF